MKNLSIEDAGKLTTAGGEIGAPSVLCLPLGSKYSIAAV